MPTAEVPRSGEEPEWVKTWVMQSAAGSDGPDLSCTSWRWS